MVAISGNTQIVSCAGVLPDNSLLIPSDQGEQSVFSHGISPDTPRHIWRLQKQSNISALMKASLFNALQQAGMVNEQLDYVIVSLVWPANILETEVSAFIRDSRILCPVVPVSAGTAGGLTALELASGLLTQGSYRNIAVVAACCYSHWFRPDDPAQSLLSDGAACMILSSKSGANLINHHTIGTHNYSPLQLNGTTTERSISYSADSGQFIVGHYPRTIAQCCRGVCENTGINLSDIQAFHIYDPTSWVASSSAEALSVDKEHIISLFLRYGSLGPAQNYFGFIHMINDYRLSEGDNVILLGFGPAATATSVLLRLEDIPVSITCIEA